jgi:hypothetical protein
MRAPTYGCRICGKDCADPAAFTEHQKTIHGITRPAVALVYYPDMGRCPTCGVTDPRTFRPITDEGTHPCKDPWHGQP